MRKISKEEVELLKLTYHSRNPELSKSLSNLQKDEMLFIEREKWESFGYKTKTPAALLSGKKNELGKRFEVRTFEEGFVITKLN